MGTGGQLDGLKYVRIGHIEEARALNDYPIAIITLASGEDTPPMPNIQLRDSFKIQIQIICSKLAGENTLYDGTNGLIDWQTKITNVIDHNSSGVPDVTFDGNVDSATRRSYDIQSLDGVLVLTQVYDLQSVTYSLGGK